MTENTTPTEVLEQAPDQPTLSQLDLARAATNDPALSPDKFTLGGREFKIIDLDYDSYIEFVALLQPLFDAVIGKITEGTGVQLPGIQLSSEGVTTSSIFKYLKKDLPEMVRIVCAMTDPSVTTEFVKKSARSPFVLAGIVMAQINRNNIITEFADFFVQILPALTTTMALVEKQTETTE